METHDVVSFSKPLGGSIRIVKQTFPSVHPKPVKRISFVAGLHGDELEGVYVCHKLIQFLRALQETQPQAFQGEIHIYPAVNPLAIENATRLWPFFSVDMNRAMGCGASENLPFQASKTFLEDLKSSADIAVDFHASNMQLKEVPQIRIIEEFESKLLPLASYCNMDLIWVHPMAGLFESTLGYNLNKIKIPTLVVESGTCLQIDQEYCEQVFTGMVNLLEKTGALSLQSISNTKIKRPQIARSKQVVQIHSQKSGLFIPQAKLGQMIKEKEPIGHVVDPVHGQILEEVAAANSGLLFTLRERPLTYAGAVLARIAQDPNSMP